MQVCRQLVHRLGFSGIGGFGDFDAHELGRQVVLSSQCAHVFGDIAGEDVDTRHVKGNRNYAKPLADALAQPRGDTLPNVLVERHHKAAFLERRDKGRGRN